MVSGAASSVSPTWVSPVAPSAGELSSVVVSARSSVFGGAVVDHDAGACAVARAGGVGEVLAEPGVEGSREGLLLNVGAGQGLPLGTFPGLVEGVEDPHQHGPGDVDCDQRVRLLVLRLGQEFVDQVLLGDVANDEGPGVRVALDLGSADQRDTGENVEQVLQRLRLRSLDAAGVRSVLLHVGLRFGGCGRLRDGPGRRRSGRRRRQAH
jgi:hypothetical protein